MKQRLAIAAALLGDPAILVLDEPTNGLDPVGIMEIRELIIELSKKGHTIIMASHLLDEVEKVCTHVAILKTGTLVTSGPVHDVLVDEDIVELSSSDIPKLKEAIKDYQGVTQITSSEHFVQLYLLKGTAKLEEINNYCFNKGVVLKHLLLKRKRLEEKFFELTNN
jgi:ABC-2 type transport system ATP-binding protein